MKQVEKLDLILKTLYQKPGMSGDIIKLLEENDVEIDLDDAWRLGRRLGDIGYVRYDGSKTNAFVTMKSEGIEFIEGDSFTHRGQSAISNHYTITNSTNANIITQSSQVTVNQNANQAKQLLEQIREAIRLDSTVDEATRKDIIDCTQEVEAGIDRGKTPKFALKTLLEMASNLSSVASLAVQIAELI